MITAHDQMWDNLFERDRSRGKIEMVRLNGMHGGSPYIWETVAIK